MNSYQSLFINPCKISMVKIVDTFKFYLNAININKINVQELQNLKITYKKKSYTLENIAKLDIKYIYLIHIIPYNMSFLIPIFKVIQIKIHFITANIVGEKIILKLSSPSTEHRNKISQKIKINSEEKKISIRNIRRTYNNKIKKYVKKFNKSGEFETRNIKAIQKITDNAIKNIIEKLQKKIDLINKI